jgi:hypothetical protein
MSQQNEYARHSMVIQWSDEDDAYIVTSAGAARVYQHVLCVLHRHSEVEAEEYFTARQARTPL